jgi:hypothetical protein
MKEKIAQLIGLQKPYNFIRLIIFIFICSRLVIYHFVPFVLESGTDIHLLDPVILKTNLLHGLYYLHSQPPLYNLFLGLLLKLNPYISIHFLAPSIYFCLGLFLCLGSFYLLKILGATKNLAFVGALAVMFFPSLIQTERWLQVFYPLAALTLAVTLLIYYFVKTRRFKYFVWFFGLLSVMVLMRSSYHLLVWLLPLMVLALVLVYKFKLPGKKYYILVMAVFFILSGSIYVKNYLNYGMFTSSTWQGFNLDLTTHYVKKADIQEMINDKKITPIVLIYPLSEPMVFYNYYHLKPNNQNPVVDGLMKSTGYPNFNNTIYPVASKEYQQDALKIILHYPGRYLMSVANEAYIFSGFFQYREFDNFNNWGSVRVHSGLDRTLLYITAFPVPLVMFLMFVWVVYWLVKKLISGINFKESSNEEQAVYVLIVFVFFNILYTFGIAIFISAGEANFLRIPIDPLFVSLAVFLAGSWLAIKFKRLKFLNKP